MEMVMSESMVKNTSQVEGRAIPEQTIGDIHVDNPRMTARHVDVFYGDKQAIDNISLDIGVSQVISLQLHPLGCMMMKILDHITLKTLTIFFQL